MRNLARTSTVNGELIGPRARSCGVSSSQQRAYPGTFLYEILPSAPATFVVTVQPAGDTKLPDSVARVKTLGTISPGYLAR